MSKIASFAALTALISGFLAFTPASGEAAAVQIVPVHTNVDVHVDFMFEGQLYYSTNTVYSKKIPFPPVPIG